MALFDAIDEVTSSRADYIYATASGSVATVTLGAIPQPVAGTNVEIHFDAALFGNARLQLELLEGATVRYDSGPVVTGPLVMSPAQWANVTTWPWSPTLRITTLKALT